MAPAGLLRLIRWPGAVTAAANALTGFLVTHAESTPSDARAACVVAAAGALVYAGGVVLNDVADAERDRTLHPARPIPSGLVERAAAARFGFALMIAGAAASMIAGGPWAGAATAAAAVFAWLYDFAAKDRRVLGAVALGLARAANAFAGVLVGAATLDVLDGSGPNVLVYPAAVFAYTALLVVVSTFEERRLGMNALGACAAALFVAGALPWAAFVAGWRAGPAIAYLPLLVTLVAAAREAAEPEGPGVGVLVRAAVFGFLLVDAAWLFGVGRYGAGFALVMGYVAMRLLLSRARS